MLTLIIMKDAVNDFFLILLQVRSIPTINREYKSKPYSSNAKNEVNKKTSKEQPFHCNIDYLLSQSSTLSLQRNISNF
jgi:hypothetical protein